MTEFFRFPHTPHLAWLGEGQPRDDKVLSVAEAEQLLREAVVLEEKVDGANLGFSLGPEGQLRVQNRGQYLDSPFRGQFSRLNSWFETHELPLIDALGSNLILFGEWAAATHSLVYDRLPDYFLVFDVYDRSAKRFWSTARRNAFARRLGIRVIHSLGSGRISLPELKRRLLHSSSTYRTGVCEGIYLRREDQDWLLARAKLVHPDFVQGIADHWRSSALRWNQVESGD